MWHIANRKRKERDEQHHKCLSSTTVDQNTLQATNNTTVARLQNGLMSGMFNVQQLVAAFSHRCVTEGRQLESVAEECYDEAYKGAEQLDTEAKRTNVKQLIKERPLCTYFCERKSREKAS